MATQTQVSGPSPYMEQYFNAAMPGFFQVANRPYQSYGGPRVAGMSDIQYNALAGIQNMMGNDPILGQAQGLLSGLMGNGYGGGLMTKPGAPSSQGFAKPLPASGVPSKPGMDAGAMFPGNPFMSQMIGDVTNQATRAYQQATDSINNRFTNPNSFGNSRHAMMQDQANEAFARGLGGALGQLQYGAYGEGLDRQMRAAQQAQGLQGQQFSQRLQALQAGSLPQAIQQRMYDIGYEDFQNAQRYPRDQAEFLMRALYGAPGGQSVTQTPDPSRTNQLLGGAALLGSLFGKPGGFSFFGN